MTYQQIIKELKEKIYRPIYFLYGEEDYFIDKVSGIIEKNVIPDESKDFNLTVMYGKDSEIEDVINAAKRFPMMCDRQVIILKEAQSIKNIDYLESYADNCMSTTTLVICYKHKKPDKRKSLYKKLAKSPNAVMMESPKLYENQIPDWIIGYCKRKNVKISTKAAVLIIEFIGTELNRISNELDKLISVCKEKTISTEDIENNIGISRDFNNFELVNALGKKDALKANLIAKYFESNPSKNPIQVTISVILNFFTSLLLYSFVPDKSNKTALAQKMGVHPYFLKDYVAATRLYSPKNVVDAISLLREYDMKSKGVNNTAGASQGEILKELIYKIMHQ